MDATDEPAPDPARSPVDLPARTAAAIAVGGALLVASAFLPWWWSGAGSSISLRDVGDLVLGAGWNGARPWWGLLAYIVPVCGGVAIIVAGVPERTARRLGLPLAALVVLLVAAFGMTMAVRHRAPSVGYGIAVLGTISLAAGAIATTRRKIAHE